MKSVKNKIWGQVKFQVCGRCVAQVGNMNQVSSKVWEQATGQVWAMVGPQVKEKTQIQILLIHRMHKTTTLK